MRIILSILFVLSVIIAIFTYLIIVGAKMNRSDEERNLEDEEQIKYIKEYEKRKEMKK